MKWIGQHIWDFISRFRSDVYLEGTDSGTIASGGNLGLDSNNKVVKSASPSGTIDLTSEVTGILPVSSGGTGANTLGDNMILTGTGTSAITAESTFSYISEILSISSSSSNKPGVYLTNSNADTTSSLIEFQKTADGADGDDIGRIIFDADNAAGEVTSFAQILSEIGTAADTDEAGRLSLQVAASDGSTSGLQQALTATGHGTSNVVNVAIGYGASSLTTIVGDLDIDGDNMTSAGAMTFTPVGLYTIVAPDISGPAFVIDADADTDNEVQIDAGLLDLNVSTTATLDAATSWTVTSPEVSFKSSTSQKPVVEIQNSTNDVYNPTLKFNNTHGGNNGASGDWLGIVSFFGNDLPPSGPPTSTEYARIYSRIDVATHGQESGSLYMDVANEDGGLGTGFAMNGGSADNEVDVNIGLGSSSLTTIAGDAGMGNTLTMGFGDGGTTSLVSKPHDDGNGGRLYIVGSDATAGQTDKQGGSVQIFGGRSTGDAQCGTIGFYSGIPAASTGTSLNSSTLVSKIQVGSGGSEHLWFEDGGTSSNDFFKLSVATAGATTLSTTDAAGNAGDITIDADGEIVLDAHTGEDIFFKENGTERIQWHMDATPTMEVTGNFDIDCSGDVEINADGGDITFKDDSATLASISAAGIVGNRKFTITADGTHFEAQGDILYFGGGSTTQGDLCYLKEDGEWGQADADGAATGDDADRDAMGMLAIALGDDPDADGMLIRGIITMDYDMGDVGNPVYVSTTAGDMTSSPPTASGDFVRVLGYCLDDSNGQIYFNPDNTWVEIA